MTYERFCYNGIGPLHKPKELLQLNPEEAPLRTTFHHIKGVASVKKMEKRFYRNGHCEITDILNSPENHPRLKKDRILIRNCRYCGNQTSIRVIKKEIQKLPDSQPKSA